MRATPSSKCCHPIPSMQALPVPEQTAGADEAEGAGTARGRAKYLYHLPVEVSTECQRQISPFHLELHLDEQTQDIRVSSPVVQGLSINPWQTHVHKPTQQWVRWLDGAWWKCRAPGQSAFQRCLPKGRAMTGAGVVTCTSEWSPAALRGHLHL